MLTQADLKAQLNYNPETGIFTWIKNNKIAGHITPYGYRIIGIKAKYIMSHKLAWLYQYGYMPQFIDHINGNRADNRISNLREATRMQNNQNANIRKDNKTGVKGVTLRKDNGKYRAILKCNKQTINVGQFNTLDEAKEAMQKAREYYHGEFAKH